jgi:HAD superfamily hydrolase (TIGR01549 family)
MKEAMLTLPKAILFDMDGTLTQDTIDFELIRADLGIGAVPILETLGQMSGEQRELAEAKLLRWELKYAHESELNAGCIDLLDWLSERRIASALITRNTRSSVQTVLAKHGLQFGVQITREDGRFKPHPEPLWLACDRLGVKPGDTWMVGDWRYDIEAGNAAGIKSVWLSHGRSPRPFEAEPWLTVKDLCELAAVLQRTEKESA